MVDPDYEMYISIHNCCVNVVLSYFGCAQTIFHLSGKTKKNRGKKKKKRGKWKEISNRSSGTSGLDFHFILFHFMSIGSIFLYSQTYHCNFCFLYHWFRTVKASGGRVKGCELLLMLSLENRNILLKIRRLEKIYWETRDTISRYLKKHWGHKKSAKGMTVFTTCFPICSD